MGAYETLTTRCGYNVRRDPINHPDSRVCVDTPAGTWYLEPTIYDSITDAVFEYLVKAWLDGDMQTIEDHVEVARHRHPGLVSLRQANDNHVRTIAVEQAVRALAPVAGAYDLPGFLGTGRADYGDAIVTLADHLGGYIQNGLT